MHYKATMLIKAQQILSRHSEVKEWKQIHGYSVTDVKLCHEYMKVMLFCCLRVGS
jgi:hypothetical protein